MTDWGPFFVRGFTVITVTGVFLCVILSLWVAMATIGAMIWRLRKFVAKYREEVDNGH
jgi:hypothetical protein